MTSTVVAPTGSAFGEFDASATWKRADTGSTGEWAVTRLRDIENSSIRDALNVFDCAFTATSSFLLFVPARQVSRTVEVILDCGDVSVDWLTDTVIATADVEYLEQRSAVTVVNNLVDLLGMPKRDVLRAAGISKSTFHTWDKPGGPRPRVGSLGQLWALAEAVDDLGEHLGSSDLVGPWILADSRRRNLLREGKFDRLLDLVASTAVTDPVPYLAGLYAVGQEKLEPRSSDATTARRRTATITSTARRARDVGRSH